MRAPATFLIAMAIVGVAAWWFLRNRDSKPATDSPAEPVAAATTPVAQTIPPIAAGTAANQVQKSDPPAATVTTVPVTDSASGPTGQQVYRLAMEGGRCSLEAVEEVRGDFHRVRQRSWGPGMLCCRLLDAKNQVVAEEVLRDPSEVCVVLDPNTAPDAKPAPAQLTPPGPVIFQVRMPKVENAAVLRIYRLAAAGPVARDAEPVGELLASIALPK